jgi:hypothetical protein
MTLEPGTILTLTEDQYEHSDGPLRLRVTRVLHHLSQYYDNKKLWVEGERLDADDEAIDKIEVLLILGLIA